MDHISIVNLVFRVPLRYYKILAFPSQGIFSASSLIMENVNNPLDKISIGISFSLPPDIEKIYLAERNITRPYFMLSAPFASKTGRLKKNPISFLLRK